MILAEPWEISHLSDAHTAMRDPLTSHPLACILVVGITAANPPDGAAQRRGPHPLWLPQHGRPRHAG
jgi:hypothetical protein